MHWLPAAFTSSTSASPSSSSRAFSPDKAMKIFYRRLRRPKRRLATEPIDPPRDEDTANSGSTVETSHPLPLPQLAVFFSRDDEHKGKTTIPSLPSPQDRPSSSRDTSGRARCSALEAYDNRTGSRFQSSSAYYDTRKYKEHAGSQRYMKSPGEHNTVERHYDDYNSAPNSPRACHTPFSSPARSTGDIDTSHYTSPPVFPLWSAPEMSPADLDIAPEYSPQMFSEILFTYNSVDSSPVHSPRASPYQSPSIPTMSPLRDKLSPSTSSRWNDSSAQTVVHPLPLPPGAISHSLSSSPSPSPSPSRSTSVNLVSAKPELTTKKSQWTKGKLIGRGTFGSVYVASNRETGALCAMKEVELLFDDPKSVESIKQLQQEIDVLSQLKHPNIVQYYGSEIVGDKFYIYLEYIHPGALNKYIREHCGAITESVIRNFTRHILSGLAYLHSSKTIHRDIKCANLLVDAYGVVKLADFGMAKHLTGQAAELSLKGSPYWLAPELLECEMQKDASSDQALAVDIWSLGCTIIEMMNGKPPWSELEGPAAMFKIMKETPPIPETLSPEGKDFLRLCLLRNPAERPTANTLLEHPFLKNSSQQHGDVTTQTLGHIIQLTRLMSP